MLLRFQEAVLAFLDQEGLGTVLPRLYSWKLSSTKRVYSRPQLAFWHFFFLLSEGKRSYIQQDLILQDLLQTAFSFLPEFCSAQDIENFLASEAFCFLNSVEKSTLAYSLSLAAPIYAEFPLSVQPRLVPEDFIRHFGQAQFAKDPSFYEETLAWSLAAAFLKLGFPTIHSLAAYQLYGSYAGLELKGYFYSDWLQILNRENFSAHQLEFYLDWIQADASLAQKLPHFLYQSADAPSTKDWQTTQAKLSLFLEDQVSKQDLIRFLYQPRVSADIYKDQDEDSLFQNAFYNAQVIDPEKQDWQAFWIGVELFQRRRENALLMQQIGKEKLVLNDSKLIVRWFLSLLPAHSQEILWAVFLDHKDQLIAYKEITRGTVNQTIAHPREVFAAAIQHRAVSLIIIHNHPSGSAQPSVNDRDITARLQRTGEIVGIELQDHIIVGTNQFYSFQESALQHF